MIKKIILIISVAVVTAACQTTTEEPVTYGNPWTEINTVAPEDGIRVLLYHDMEGLAGQDDPRTFEFSEPEYYPQGQLMLIADLNAVIEGLFAGGAAEVHIVDGHGSGNLNPDVRTDLLDGRAKQVFKDEYYDAYFDLAEMESYDAVGVVGMHAKTGSGGFASHTFTLGIDFLINGQSITETELVGLSWGRFDTPVIFASGDDRLQDDLRTMPWIQYVRVKTATSANTADLRPVDEVHTEMTAAAQRAVENLANAKVMKVKTPFRASLRAVEPAGLDVLDGVPGIDYSGNTVTFEADGMREAYDGLVALVGVARTNYASLMFANLRTRPEFPELLSAYRDSLIWRWFDVESGRWSPPERQDPMSRRGHGYR